MASQEDYIFDTIPYNPEFELNYLNDIQDALQTGKALDANETTIFLDWITYNARSYAVDTKKEFDPQKIFTDPMTGSCAPTQRINVELLNKFGLDARPFNTADCMGEIPKNSETERRIQNGWHPPKVKHAVTTVDIPIKDKDGNVSNYKFLLDPTFRQFCLKENCVEKEEWSEHGYGAPHTGYFMQKDNLMQLDVPEDEAQKSENIGKYLVERGYLLLNEENARLYMEAFRRASIDKENQKKPHNISGYEYIYNMENNIAELRECYGKKEEYTRVPSEIIEQEYLKNRTIFSKIKNIFKKIFSKNNTQALGPGGDAIINVEIPNKPKLERVVLTEEEELQFRAGETQILSSYHENQNQYVNPIIEKEDYGKYYE